MFWEKMDSSGLEAISISDQDHGALPNSTPRALKPLFWYAFPFN